MSAPGRAGEADRTLFVGNLEGRVREEILYELFLQVAEAGSARGAGPRWGRGQAARRVQAVGAAEVRGLGGGGAKGGGGATSARGLREGGGMWLLTRGDLKGVGPRQGAGLCRYRVINGVEQGSEGAGASQRIS